MMLEWFAGHARKAVFREAAATIDAAVDGALAAPDVRTADPGGRVTTRSFAQAVADRVRG